MTTPAVAQQQNDNDKPVREIFVPFEVLNVILEGQTQRVFLTRREYEELLAKAKGQPAEGPSLPATLLTAEYTGTLEEGRAKLAGTIVVDLRDGDLHAVPLDLSGVGLRSATLDDKPASIGLSPEQKPILFVQGKGRHTLKLEMVVPLETTAALQSLNFQVPAPATARLRLTVPGNVEVKSGAEVIDRQVDEQAGVTRLELLPRRGQTSLVMTLNNRLLRRQQVVVASSVLVAEITAAYERLHATVSVEVLHGGVDRFRFALPEGFEVSDVTSPLLAQWEVKEEQGRRVLEARLNETTSENVVLNISAVRAPAVLEGWTFPQLEPLDVSGHVAVVGLIVEDRLKAEGIESTGLIAINNSDLTSALPVSIFEAEPGAPRVRPVVTYYAPQAKFSLQARFVTPAASLRATTNVLLILGEKQQQVRGSFALVPEVEKVFSIDFSVPAGWQVLQTSDAGGNNLPFEVYSEEQKTRVKVRLPQGVPPGQPYSVFFHAVSTPSGWLADWTQTSAAFPVFALSGVARDSGAIAVQAQDDLTVRPDKLTQLTPLDENEKAKYGLAGVATNLAYRYDGQPYEATFTVERITPRITARTYSFFRIDQESLAAHYEIVYEVAEARTRRLSLRLPAGTPAALSIRALDGVALNEYTSETLDGTRHWTAQLAEARSGTIRLAIDFTDTLPAEAKELALPVVQADGVTYQSGMVAVEGAAELDVQVVAHPRRVDVGELVDAEYQPGRRLLGAFEFIGGTAEVKVNIAPRPGYGLATTIVERAELRTFVSTAGRQSWTAARYQLRTKDLFLELRLPARSELWSVQLDGKPGQPQTENGALLVNLPPSGASAVRDLQIVYETPMPGLSLSGELEMLAPELLLRADAKAASIPVPMADLVWYLHLPPGFRVTRSDGTVFTQLAKREAPLEKVAKVFYVLGGGVQPMLGGQAPMLAAKREAGESKFAATEAEAAYSRGSYTQSIHRSGETTAVPGFDGDVKMKEARDRLGLARERGSIDHENALPRPAAEMPSESKADAPRKTESEPTAPSAPPPATSPVPATGEGIATFQTPSRRTGKGGEEAGAEGKEGGKRTKYWALEGVRSLKIDVDVQKLAPAVQFHSLGQDPKLDVTVVNQPRIDALRFGLALLAGLIGLLLTPRRASVKVRYVVLLLLIATLPPLTGLVDAYLDVFDAMFVVGCLLVPYYIIAGILQWTFGTLRRPAIAPTAAAAVAIILLCTASSNATAQEPGGIVAELEKLLGPTKPVSVPADAIIVPYNPDDPEGVQKAEKVLVTYDKYVELWNRAYPDRKIETKAPPAEYSLAGAAYSATLEGDEYLLLTGHLDFDLFVDAMVAIPLPLEGAVLAKAEIAGNAAKIKVAELAAGKGKAAVPGGNFFMLYASGKGRHRLDLEVRVKLERRGGWRIASARVPHAPATALVLTAPAAQTEVRLAEVLDRRAYETTMAAERIETVLAPGGLLRLEWRPKVGEAMVDRTLTANSMAWLDVREDGLRLAWQLKLEFRRSQRESFTVSLPAGYLVEKVAGTNVRGWQLKPGEMRQELEITLLKAARDEETFTIHLSRRGAIGQEQAQQIEAPYIAVTDAVLHHGQIAIRRSPILDVRTVASEGLTRTDAPANMNADTGGASPLGVRAYQAFSFVATPFTLTLSVSTVPPDVSAEVQTLLKLSQRDPTLESQVLLRPKSRPVYMVRAHLPANMKLDRVSVPGLFEWSVTDDNNRKLLTVYMAGGQSQPFTLLVTGTFEQQTLPETFPIPNLAILDVERQQGDIVVQADPAFDVRTENLAGLESVLLERTFGWLQPAQRASARLALQYRTAEHGGTLRIAARRPRVNSFTLTNVKVTDRAVLETILLEFRVRDAGVRELVFVLPVSMQGMRIRADKLRQKTVTPVDNQVGSPLRVRLEFQEEMMGQLRVIVENDRLLTKDTQLAPIPTVETGETDQRYVTLEVFKTSRDEVVVDAAEGLEPISRQQTQWQTLASLLSGNITQAYLVREGAAAPRLAFRTKDRTALETAGARIGLAQTMLAMDPSGAYRAAVEFRVDNRTEQFLEVALPAGAELWTAFVAGEPVKPSPAVEQPSSLPGGGDSEAPAGGTRSVPATLGSRVRIPLIKTAAGDQDYAVILKYAGSLSKLSGVRSLSFPLVRTVNINVERSNVRLWLPENYRWFNFGGTMRLTSDAGDLQASVESYKGKQIQLWSDLLRSEDEFAKARAASNLKQLEESTMLEFRELSGSSSNPELRKQAAANYEALQHATRQIAEEEGQVRKDGEQSRDNRRQLNELFDAQYNTRAKNVVNELGGNFADPQAVQPAAPQGEQRFSQEWLERNKLNNPMGKQPMATSGRFVEGTVGEDKKPGEPQQQAGGQGQQPQAAGILQLRELEKGNVDEFGIKKAQEEAQQKQQTGQQGDRGEFQGRSMRYQQRLEQQNRLNAPQGQPMPDDRPASQPDGATGDFDRGGMLQGGAGHGAGGLGPGGLGPGALGPGGGGGALGPGGLGPGGFDRSGYAVPGLPSPSTAPGAEGRPGTTTGLGVGEAFSADLDARRLATFGQIIDGTSNTAFVGEKAIRKDAGALVSLDVELPTRGREFLFTTPRGEVEITAQAISEPLLDRLIRAGWVLLAIVVGYLGYRLIAAVGVSALTGRVAGVGLIVAGLVSLVTCIFPLAGLAAIVLGAVLTARWYLVERRLAKATG